MNDIPKAPSIPPPPEDKAPAPEKMAPPAKKKIGFWSRLFRWVMGFLIVFGLGALLIILLFYIPLQRQFATREAEVSRANQQVAGLQATAQSFSPLDSQNKDLQTQLDEANAQIALLSARSDVLAAELALAKNDAPRARLALSKTNQTLENLAKLLPADQKKVVDDLQARLKLALEEIDANPYAAQSDLDVMATSLLEMHNALVR